MAKLTLSCLVLGDDFLWPAGPPALQLGLADSLRHCFALLCECTRGHVFPGAHVGEGCFRGVETQESVPGYLMYEQLSQSVFFRSMPLFLLEAFQFF